MRNHKRKESLIRRELVPRETRVLNMAEQLLSIAIQTAAELSAEDNTRNAYALHESEKLYPKMIITRPHGGGATYLKVSFCDPFTNEDVIRLIQLEAKAETTH